MRKTRNFPRILGRLSWMLLLLPVAARAQLNESDTFRVQYVTALNGSWQSGNLSALTGLSRLETSVGPSARWAFKTQQHWRYQAFYGRKSDNDFSSRNFLYAGQRRRIYPFILFFASANFRRKIDGRYFTGPGATWQVWRERRHTVKLSVAAVYESTHFAGRVYNYPRYDGSAFVRTWRATARLAGQVRGPGQRLRAGYELYVQPSLDRADNFRWLLEQTLELSLWKGLAFNTFLQYSHENLVIATVRPDDLIVTFGVGWRGKY